MRIDNETYQKKNNCLNNYKENDDNKENGGITEKDNVIFNSNIKSNIENNENNINRNNEKNKQNKKVKRRTEESCICQSCSLF